MPSESRQLKYLSQLVAEIHSVLQPAEQKPRKSFWLRIIGFAGVVIVILFIPFLLGRLNKYEALFKGATTLGVEQLVRQIQTEIEKSEEDRKSKGIAPMFELKSFELEISFVARNTLTQTGNAHFEIVTVDSQVQVGSERTHKLTLTMDVISHEGTAAQSTSRPPEDGQVLTPIPPIVTRKE